LCPRLGIGNDPGSLGDRFVLGLDDGFRRSLDDAFLLGRSRLDRGFLARSGFDEHVVPRLRLKGRR
jgi:hypothetical protein